VARWEAGKLHPGVGWSLEIKAKKPVDWAVGIFKTIYFNAIYRGLN
jgi:hypothetical protein